MSLIERLFRRIDKLSLQLYLLIYFFFGRIRRPNLYTDEGGILIFADLLMGDLAMAGYLIQSIRHHYPTKKITLLCKENLFELASLFNLDLVIPVTYLSWKLYMLLSKQKYALVFNIFSGKWLPLCDGLTIGKICGTHLCKFEKPMNMVDMILSIRPSSISIKTSKLSLPTSNKKNYIVIHIGARVKTRLWPIGLLKDIIKFVDMKIILTGLEQEQTYMDELNSEKIENMLGKTTYIELLSLINNSTGLISMDTGVIHWARLMKIPSLSVLGPSDMNLFGAKSNQFENAYHMLNRVKCQDVHKHMGIPVSWVNHCNRRTCIFREQKCTKFSIPEVENTIKEFMKNLKTKTKIEYSD